MLAFPASGLEPEFVELCFAEQAEPIDRLRAIALALPPGVIDDVELREPIGAAPPAADRRGRRALRRAPGGRRTTRSRTPC